MFRAVSQRIIRYNPFEHAEYEKVEKTIRFLSKSYVANLMAMKICDSDAELARRMFVFFLLYRFSHYGYGTLDVWAYQERSGRTDVYKKGASEDQDGVHCAVTPHCQDDYRAAKATTSGERRKQ